MRPTQVIMEWEAPERMFETKSREYYRKIAVIIIFVMLLLIIIKELILMIVLVALFFAVYVFHTIPPRNIRHQITTNGINYASEHLYGWAELKSFFIKKQKDTNILNINTVMPLPGRILMLLGKDTSSQEISDILNQYISIVEKPEEEPLDKISSAIARRIKL